MNPSKDEIIASWESMGLPFNFALLDAFRFVKRELFVLPEHKEMAYLDRPLPIGPAQTISQPRTVLLMTRELEVRPGMSVLEIGTGSGYQAAILSHLVGKDGHVYSIETVHDLVSLAQRNLRKAGVRNVTVNYGDGSQGFEAKAPYDRIIVTAAAPSIPRPLTEQLKDGGRLVIPVGMPTAILHVVSKKGKEIIDEEKGEFSFVPLRGKHGFKD